MVCRYFLIKVVQLPAIYLQLLFPNTYFVASMGGQSTAEGIKQIHVIAIPFRQRPEMTITSIPIRTLQIAVSFLLRLLIGGRTFLSLCVSPVLLFNFICKFKIL